jgi:hypothetical protein
MIGCEEKISTWDHYRNDSSHKACEVVPSVNFVEHFVEEVDLLILPHRPPVIIELRMNYFCLELGKTIVLKYQTSCHDVSLVYSRDVDYKANATIDKGKNCCYVAKPE